jgi:hypothetical protein
VIEFFSRTIQFGFGLDILNREEELVHDNPQQCPIAAGVVNDTMIQ